MSGEFAFREQSRATESDERTRDCVPTPETATHRGGSAIAFCSLLSHMWGKSKLKRLCSSLSKIGRRRNKPRERYARMQGKIRNYFRVQVAFRGLLDTLQTTLLALNSQMSQTNAGKVGGERHRKTLDDVRDCECCAAEANAARDRLRSAISR